MHVKSVFDRVSQCSWAAVPGQLGLCASLGGNIVAVGLRSRGVWRSQW